MSNKSTIDYTTWDTDELKETKAAIEKVLGERRVIQEKSGALTRNINGITAADFVVIIMSLYKYGYSEDDHIRYSFLINRGDSLYDIYYDHGSHDKETNKYSPYEWWPWAEREIDDESGLPYDIEPYDDNHAYLFIPPGFNAGSENCYSFTGTEEEAIAKLKEYGITDIRVELEEGENDGEEE